MMHKLFLRRRVAVCFLPACLLMNGLAFPAAARDKTTVTVQCSTTKVVLTCTKFDGGHCIASTLSFDTPRATRTVLPAQKIPQNFVVPTIADDVSCWEGNGKFALDVFYTPGCQYDGCIVERAYDLNGASIVDYEERGFQDYFGKEVQDPTLIFSVNLRGDE